MPELRDGPPESTRLGSEFWEREGARTCVCVREKPKNGGKTAIMTIPNIEAKLRVGKQRGDYAWESR